MSRASVLPVSVSAFLSLAAFHTLSASCSGPESTRERAPCRPTVSMKNSVYPSGGLRTELSFGLP